MGNVPKINFDQIRADFLKPLQQEPVFMKCPQVSKLLGLSEDVVREALRDGKIPSTVVSKKWLVSKYELADWVAGVGNLQKVVDAGVKATGKRLGGGK